MSMTIAIQDLDSDVAAWLEEVASRKGVTLERLVYQLIQEHFDAIGQGTRRRVCRDLDHLSGTWSEEEYGEFLRATADFEMVDETLWQ